MRYRNSMFTSILILLLGGGCYNRTTDHFATFPDINDLPNAIIDESGLTEEDRSRRLEYLKELDKEPETIYTINARDKIGIKVYNHSELNMVTTVAPDGTIGSMFIGQVMIAGLTLKEASEKLSSLYSEYLKNPEVAVYSYEVHSQNVTISGAVTKPGMYRISNGMRLADLFAQAGGASIRKFDDQSLDAADYQHSLFIRNGEYLPVDFSKAIEKGDRWHNVKLKRDDYIYIATRSEAMVSIIGCINRPHKRLWDQSLGILELISSGLGLREEYWRYGVIIRGGTANPRFYRVDIDGILQGLCSNVRLQPGDTVYIPHDDISEFNVFIRKILPSLGVPTTVTSPVIRVID